MNNKLFLSVHNCQDLARSLDNRIKTNLSPLNIYPIPRGGIPVAFLLKAINPTKYNIVEDPNDAVIAVDDIVDSGVTATSYFNNFNLVTYALIDKIRNPNGSWYVFPWETKNGEDAEGVQDNVRRIIQFIGEDVTRGGLKETPARVEKALAHWFSGYKYTEADVAAKFKSFEDGAENYDEMIVRRNIPLYSHCVVGSTFIETPKGRIPISRLKHNDWIYTMHPETMELSIVRCVNPRITQRNAKLVCVHTDNNTLICTPDHRVLTTEGVWVEAKDLKNNMRLASFYRAGEKFRSDAVVYPKIITSRYTRWHNGIKLFGTTEGMLEHRFIKQFTDNINYSDGRRFVTHHKDERVWNNVPENLEIMTIAQHNREHQRTQKLAHTDVRAKRASSVKAYWDALKQDPARYDKRCQQTSEGIERSGRNHVVFGVEELDYTEDVWCMNVPETNLFFANGIAVHNCEHHMADIFGTCTVAYIPKDRVLGLSKMDRIVDIYARRLQVQERLTTQIANAMWNYLDPVGVGVYINARHMCIESRGVCNQNSETITTALRGTFKDEPDCKAEFLNACKP